MNMTALSQVTLCSIVGSSAENVPGCAERDKRIPEAEWKSISQAA